MKNEITIPVLREENTVAAKMRRDNYAVGRDLKMQEFNDAITKRLLAEAKNKVKCGKCGKEFGAEKDSEGPYTCPDCQ